MHHILSALIEMIGSFRINSKHGYGSWKLVSIDLVSSLRNSKRRLDQCSLAFINLFWIGVSLEGHWSCIMAALECKKGLLNYCNGDSTVVIHKNDYVHHIHIAWIEMFVTERYQGGLQTRKLGQWIGLVDYLDLPGLIANMAMVLEIQRVSI